MDYAKEISVDDICKKVHDNVIGQSKLDIYCSKIETIIPISFEHISYQDHDLHMDNLKINIKNVLESPDWKWYISNHYNGLPETKITIHLPHQSNIVPFL